MRTHLMLAGLVLLGLPGCADTPDPPPVFGPVIVLHPPPVAHPRPRVLPPAPLISGNLSSLPLPPVEADPPPAAAKAVAANYHVASQLASAYVAAPGVTVEGIQRVRVLQLAAERAVLLMQHHKPARAADADNAAAAVTELLDQVK